MNIFIKIKNSIYNPKYYSEVITKPFSYSLKYYLVFALIFALAFSIVATIEFVPIVNLLSEQVTKLSEYFPEGLEITIKDGKASTNAPEPYAVEMPANLKSTEKEGVKNLIVLDTREKFNLDTFSSFDTYAILNSDSLAYVNGNGQISITSLSSVKNFTLNKGQVESFINTVKPFVVYIYPFIFIGAYFVGFMIMVAEMIFLLFGALLIWLVAKIKGVKIGYKKSYQTGIHLITLPIIIASVVGLIPTNFTIPYLFTILLILSAALNLKKEIMQPVAPTV